MTSDFHEAWSYPGWLDFTTRRDPLKQPVFISPQVGLGFLDPVLDGQVMQTSKLLLGPLFRQENPIASNTKALAAQGVFDQLSEAHTFF
jgi:hypothetical protein